MAKETSGSPHQSEAIDPNLVYQNALFAATELQPDFVVDEFSKPVFRALSLYFANDKRFESEGHGKLNKGIFLSGDVGTGKTLIMEAFLINPRRRFHLLNTNTVAFDYQSEGLDNIQRYFGHRDSWMINHSSSICFDDLGSELAFVKFMGNGINVLEKIILSRYERRLPFSYTHFTTNINGPEIERIYGERVRSRIKEMTNFIVIDGKDRRI